MTMNPQNDTAPKYLSFSLAAAESWGKQTSISCVINKIIK
jgi:hypothetical protein